MDVKFKIPQPWNFNDEVSFIFDEHIRQSVPLYEELHKIVAQISYKFLFNNAFVLDLGTATGEVILNIYKQNDKENIFFYGIDNSEAMLRVARQKCKDIKKIKFINSDITDLIFPKSNFITSIYTLQFIDVENRAKIIKKIYNSLVSNGAFVLCEKIKSNSEIINENFAHWHEEYKFANGLDKDEIELKKQSLKGVLVPIGVDEYLKMLKNVGFSVVDIFFKYYNFVGFLAIKN